MKKLFVAALLIGFSSPAQYFGQNKARYKNFDFKVMQSPHFEMYHYFNNPDMSKRMIVNTENWYKQHQEVFKTAFGQLNPIIFYKTHPDFQETTAISGQIGEGTGGVTEGLKNRVVMPLMYSHRQTDHVLGHELVHAFQYHTFATGDSTTMENIGNLPLFMVEGLAEYMSIGRIDSHTAMWLRDGVLNSDLPTIEDLVVKQNKYFPYRWGEAFWAYVAGSWGDDVIRPLFRESGKRGVESAFNSVLNLSTDRFSVRWKKAITDYYSPLMVGTSKEPIGTVIASEEKGGGRMNVSPSISPDGRYIAYISERNILSTDIYIADAKTGKTVQKINTSGFSAHVDSYSFIESAGTWSPDGSRLAIVIQSKGRNKIMVINTSNENKKVYDFGPNPESFTNPSWSPDGKSIVVSGLSDGLSDLYLLDLASEKVTNITKDIYSDLQPTYSPDGKYIYFVSDRNPKYTRLEKANFNISRIELSSKKVENYLFFEDADNYNPQIDATGQNIFFLSDHDGFRNLFKYNIANKQIEKLTNFSTGISGITPFSPAMTVASKSGEIAYTHYFKGAYNIYTANASAFSATPYTETYRNKTVAYMPPGEASRGRDIVQGNLESQTIIRVPESQLNSLAYKSKFKMDYLGSTGMGVGVTNSGRTGVAGGVQTVFSDILGNNQIMGAASLNGEIQDFGGQFLYLNQKKPLQWGFSAMHVPYSLTGQAYGIDTLPAGNGGKVPVQKLTTQTLRQFFSTIESFGFFPLNTFQRFETGGGFNFVNYSLINYDQYYDAFDQFLGENRQKEKLPLEFKGLNYQQLYLAFVGDNSQFGLTSPLKGYRYRFEARQMFGSTTKLINYTVDIRKYAFKKPFTIATRVMYNARQGRDAGTGQLNPLFLGYMGYVRGFYREDRRQDLDHQLAGSQMAMGNLEFRLPFTGPKRLAVIPSNYVFSDLAMFLDFGSAWDGKNVVRQTANNIFQGIYSDNGISKNKFDPIMSTGLSLRINAMGYLIIEPYYVLPFYRGMASGTSGTAVRKFHPGYFGINLVPGW